MPSKPQSSDYVLRIMTPALISDAWPRWLADAMIMRQINAKPYAVSKAQLAAYLTTMQARKIGVVGMFRRRDVTHAGVYEVQIDQTHRLANLSVLIDFKGHDIARVFGDTETELLQNLARLYAVDKAAMVVPASYKRFLPVPTTFGWSEEGRLRQEFHVVGSEDTRIDGICYGKPTT
jgi:hypothetical protein